MKKYILSVVLSVILGSAFAQDPQLSAPNVNPSPALVSGPVTVSLNFYNSSTVPIIFTDENDATIVSFSLNKIQPTLDANGNPVVSGDGAQYFTWQAFCSNCVPGVVSPTDQWDVFGIQNQTIPGSTIFSQTGGPINIAGTVIGAATLDESNAKNGVGFNANITPASNRDIDISPASNNQSTYAPTNGVFPVTLTSFMVQKEGQFAVLRWATTEETNSDYFEIQHSVTGKEWAKIGKVASHGESTTLKNYTFAHSTPVNGENLYRLRMVDKDQTFAYSRIQSVKFGGLTDADLSVYPNPVADKLFIRDVNQVTKVVINDMNGRSVYAADKSISGEINVHNLHSGIYLVNITLANGQVSSQKIVVGR